jgi:hypothetical protein
VIDLRQELMQDTLVCKDVEGTNTAQIEQEHVDGNQILLSNEVRTVQDSPSDTQLATIPKDGNSDTSIERHVIQDNHVN